MIDEGSEETFEEAVKQLNDSDREGYIEGSDEIFWSAKAIEKIEIIERV